MNPYSDIEFAKKSKRKLKMIQNRYWGQTLESFLEEAGMLEEANAYATKRILTWQISEARKEQEISPTDLGSADIGVNRTE